MKASDYGIKNLKRIVPNLIAWTAEDGKDYEELGDLYEQVLGQFSRYMGHVTANIGGIYENYKTYDQEGAVYTHVPKEIQQRAMKFLSDQLFNTPTWLLDQSILNKIEFDGAIERMRMMQSRTLESILDFGRLARAIENEAINGDKAYTILEILEELRNNVWTELKTGGKIDVYRRNLQRAHIDQLAFLMTEEQAPMPAEFKRFINRTDVSASQSDIRSVARAELNELKKLCKAAIAKTTDKLSKYHLEDAIARIDLILDPK
jgi:hypothetical protein